MMLHIGDQAPDFAGETQDGKKLRLCDFEGRKVVLYFYPKDNTPGCTLEACSIRNHWAKFEEAGIDVIGVSGDSVQSHQKFSAKHKIPFALLADTEKEVMKAYGVWRDQRIYGNTFLGIRRMTFLIDEAGKIVKIFKRPNTILHGKEILSAFASLKNTPVADEPS